MVFEWMHCASDQWSRALVSACVLCFDFSRCGNDVNTIFWPLSSLDHCLCCMNMTNSQFHLFWFSDGQIRHRVDKPFLVQVAFMLLLGLSKCCRPKWMAEQWNQQTTELLRTSLLICIDLNRLFLLLSSLLFSFVRVSEERDTSKIIWWTLMARSHMKTSHFFRIKIDIWQSCWFYYWEISAIDGTNNRLITPVNLCNGNQIVNSFVQMTLNFFYKNWEHVWLLRDFIQYHYAIELDHLTYAELEREG